jgi:hypothetical protein
VKKTLCDVCGEEIQDSRKHVIVNMQVSRLLGTTRKVTVDAHRRCAKHIFAPIRHTSERNRVRQWLFDALDRG